MTTETAPAADRPSPAARFWPLAVLLGLPLVLVFPALRPGQFLYGVDAMGGYYNLRAAVGQSLAEGRLPVWDPHAMAGAPLLAALHAAVLYPPTWLSALLGPAASWTAAVFLHLVLAGGFAYFWLGRGLGHGREAALAGAVLFQLSSFIGAQVFGGHLAHLSTVAWAPAVLWRLERFLAGPTLRRACLLALCTTLMILAGLPQFVLIVGLAIAARLAQEILRTRDGRSERAKAAAGAVASMALGGLWAAPQLLPTLELVGQGQRASISSQAFASSYSASPVSFLTLLAPMLFGNGREVGWWGQGAMGESPGFVGLAGLALAALGLFGQCPQRRLWAGLALAALPLALGRHTPIFGIFASVVPGAGLFRVPARYLFLFTLSAAPLAAMGFERLWTADPAARRQALWIAGAATVLAIAGAGYGFSLDGRSGWWSALHERERQAVAAEDKADSRPTSEQIAARRTTSALSLQGMALSAAALAVILFLYGPTSRRARGCAAALALLLVAELWVHDSHFFSGQSVEGMEWPPEFQANVRHHPAFPFRIATVTPQQIDAVGKCQASGLDHVGGYDPMMLRRYTELVNVARGKPATDLIVAMALSRPGPVFDLLGARYWIVPGPRQEPPGWRTVGEMPSGFVYENPRALPRAFLVGQSVSLPAAEDRLRYLARPEFDASRVVVLEGEASGTDGSIEPVQGSVRIRSMEPGRYDLETESPRDAWLVLSEAGYPGWSADIDGASAEIHSADHLVQAVRVRAGRHEVRFRFRSRFLGVGFGLAALAALIPTGILLLRRVRASSVPASPPPSA
jgi:hypothetical protein